MSNAFLFEERFRKAVPKAGEMVTEVALQTVELAEAQPKDSSRVVVLIRSLKAILGVLEKIDASKVASASSDFEVILSLLEEPEVISELSKKDPLASAKLRGLRAQMQIAQAEGGCLPAEEAGEMIGIGKAAVHKARSEGRLLGLPRGQNQFAFPVWQFSSGKILTGLKDVYAALNCDPWMKASFMLAKNTRLDGETPLSVLRRGEIARAVQAAKLYGEHGAV
ncbi:MAG: hypothetical protein P4L53_28730 [Candidatus Obscuribacterales bacterium]|nr:hypothetical protein [Candidatus Obscuribacterales bacterium]